MMCISFVFIKCYILLIFNQVSLLEGKSQVYIMKQIEISQAYIQLVLRQRNFRQNFTRKFPETFGTKV